MDRGKKTNNRRIVGIIVLAVLLTSIFVWGKSYMDHKRDEKLAIKAEHIVARQLKNNLTGITEIKFTRVLFIDDGTGTWPISFLMKTTWDKEIAKEDLRTGWEYYLPDPTNPLNSFSEVNVMDPFGYGRQKTADAFKSHSGKTNNKIKIIYSDKSEEILK